MKCSVMPPSVASYVSEKMGLQVGFGSFSFPFLSVTHSPVFLFSLLPEIKS